MKSFRSIRRLNSEGKQGVYLGLLIRNIQIGLLMACVANLIACAQDDNSSSRCEPCPDGFACTQTPFGTFDCLPVRNTNGSDGSLGNHSFDASVAMPHIDMNSAQDSPFDSELPIVDLGVGTVDQRQTPSDQGTWIGADASMPVVDSIPLPQKPGRAAAGRVTRLDIPTNVVDARLSGCTVVGQNAGSGLSGVLTILGTTLSEQFQPDASDNIPLILLSDFVDWESGMTSAEYGNGSLEFYLGAQRGSNQFEIDSSVILNGISSDGSRIRFETSFIGDTFTTNNGEFVLETSSLGLPFLVELQFTSLAGRVDVTEDGALMVDTALNGYLSFPAVRRLVMAIQAFCNASPSDRFCMSANRFLDGDPSTSHLDGDTAQIARDVILPLMRNLDTRLTNEGPVPCDPFCDGFNCVECNAVSVCGLLETIPVELDE